MSRGCFDTRDLVLRDSSIRSRCGRLIVGRQSSPCFECVAWHCSPGATPHRGQYTLLVSNQGLRPGSWSVGLLFAITYVRHVDRLPSERVRAVGAECDATVGDHRVALVTREAVVMSTPTAVAGLPMRSVVTGSNTQRWREGRQLERAVPRPRDLASSRNRVRVTATRTSKREAVRDAPDTCHGAWSQ